MADEQAIDDGLAALLRGDIARADALMAGPAGLPGDIVQRADYHGIAHLLAIDTRNQPAWPQGLADQFRESAMAREFWEASHMRLVQPALAALAGAGVTPVVMKGTALAYSLYANPASRTRGDTDLLVSPQDLARTRLVLADLGFSRGEDAHGTLFQETWRAHAGKDLTHAIDLHWQVNDSPVLQQALPLEPALANAQPLPRLGEGVRSLGHADSLLQLAFNAKWHSDFGFFLGGERVTGTPRLIWAHDVHLLLGEMDRAELDRLASHAVETGAAAALLEAIEHAVGAFGTPVDAGAMDKLRRAPANTAIMRYLQSSDPVGRRKADLRATRGLRAKARFVANMLLPSPRHLYRRFPRAQGWPLPALYLRYAFASAGRLFFSRD